jgi:hypothetical protein
MAFAIRSSPLVRVSARHSASSPPWRTILKALAGSVVALSITVLTVSLAIVGTGRLIGARLGVPPQPRLAIALAPSPDLWNQTAFSTGSVATPSAIVAEVFAGETMPASGASEPDPVDVTIAVAAALPEAGESAVADPDITGSLGPASSASTTLQLAAAPAPISPIVDAPPLPRARPLLASLPPGGALEVAPGEDAYPPRTAIYDISAQTVYLPNGEQLEAHSGYGDLMDDPRYVSRKNKGATPPNVYKLRLRESLFHGVQAIRLTPVNEAAMFGRDGILAHSYLLGPNGQSNGCVSIKDYDRFLRAYLDGGFDRMIVVARHAKPPTFARPVIQSAANTH